MIKNFSNNEVFRRNFILNVVGISKRKDRIADNPIEFDFRLHERAGVQVRIYAVFALLLPRTLFGYVYFFVLVKTQNECLS